uniref:NELL2-interacting cell ontogeny regulator 1 n=1 Tax=Amazona collaria TaxID=241587 RepID=A0A8B9F6C9_9PSIT
MRHRRCCQVPSSSPPLPFPCTAPLCTHTGTSCRASGMLCIPGRPCVDCHAFEFMQRALQDLKKTAYSLDTRVCVSIGMLLLSLYLQVARSACLRTADVPSLLTHFHFSK